MPGFLLTDPHGPALIPPMSLQSVRTMVACMRNVENKLLFKTWGGLGDQICAEPTLRFAIETFNDCEVYLYSEVPEMFRHLKFKGVFDPNNKPEFKDYLCFETIVSSEHILWEFCSHMTTHCVDFPSICAFRSQLPIKDREIKLCPNKEELDFALSWFGEKRKESVVLHPGRHWPSKTFPKDWWDDVIARLLDLGLQVVLIGADADDNRGTVDVNAKSCIDTRSKFSIMQTVALLQQAPVLVTNDSSPLHMAASGSAWIGFVATCKHPDYITHWRNGQFGWRMENLGVGGYWDVLNFNPNSKEEVTVEFVDPELLRSWLPEPESVAHWVKTKINEENKQENR